VKESGAISRLLPPALVASASGDADDTAWVAAPWLSTFSCGLTALVPGFNEKERSFLLFGFSPVPVASPRVMGLGFAFGLMM
jgi:hypothetical protein